MASQIQFSFTPGRTCYTLIFNQSGQIWNSATNLFETYSTANYANYALSATQQGSSSPFYLTPTPVQLPAGDYSIAGKQQLGGSVAETDPSIAVGNYSWNGTGQTQLADMVTSGLFSAFQPLRLARGVMVKNFPLYFKSNADHITPLTSGVVSGQIIRDPVSGSTWGALQSGAFTEQGNGYYALQSLTSGDLNANTIMLLFNAAGVSGGLADPLPMSFITQRISGAITG